MKIKKMIIAAATLMMLSVYAQMPSDSVILDMAAAFKKSDHKTLARLLPSSKGHPLEPWAAYWELKARLGQAGQGDVDAFLQRFAGTYQEDRLRADWLLLLGQRRDWSGFAAYYPAYRMGDDKDIRCYANPSNAALIEALWMSQKEMNSGCGAMAEALIDAGKMSSLVAWRKDFPTGDPKTAMQRAKTKLQPSWSAAQRNWALGMQAKHLALKLDLEALAVYAKVTDPKDLSDEMLAWWVRPALRIQDWQQVARAIGAMSAQARADSTWVYWLARATKDPKSAAALFESISVETSKTTGFYEILASEALGRTVTKASIPQSTPLTAVEHAGVRANKGLQRALLAIQIGLRAEGVREWNYEVNLAKGSMSDRERLAAADWACSLQVWDRCINTSERTQNVVDWSQRFPMPHLSAVVRQAQSLGLDPAYVYGLMRQESRFITDARSHVGAAGLMQIMPATARWTAKKIGLSSFSQEKIADLDINLLLGVSYLKLVLDDFEGPAAEVLAAAAYNAGPSRARAWRAAMTQTGAIESAAWAENIPFNETRDYVKKVLSNAHQYSYQTPDSQTKPAQLKQILRLRLGVIAARENPAQSLNSDLP